MPIITKPSPLEKDATGIFSLDKTALALHPTVVASAHFSSPNVWNKIILKYKSETLGQFESVEFDATVASPEGQFFVSATAEDIFEVEKITIIDKDGAILLIPRADLTVAEFDIDFGAGVPQPVPVMWLANPAYVLEGDGGATASATRPSYPEYSLTFADPSQYVTGDFTFEAVLSSTYTSNNFIGFYDSTTPTITTAFTGTSIYFEQATVTGYSIPTSPTYTVKIQRIGLNVKFYVNNVELYSGTHTDINKAKVPFFTFTDNVKYIVSASLTLPEAVATYIDWTESANYNTSQIDGGLTSNIADYNDTNLSSMNFATQDVSQGTGKVLTYKIKSSDLYLGGYAFIGFGLSNTFWGFYKNNPTAGNSLSLLYGNSVIGTYTGIVNNSTIVTLEIKTKSTAFEFWIDGVKVGESTAITSGTLKPTARIYQGMEITEAYFA